MKFYHDRTLHHKYNMKHKYINVLTNFIHVMLLILSSIYIIVV